MTLLDSRIAETSAPISPVLAARWSPRSYDENIAIGDEQLTSVLEAARWTPSASNKQAWRFIVARRGSETFAKIVETLAGFNQIWAVRAGALVVAVAETAEVDGTAGHPWVQFDLGQAVAHLSIQAHKDGLFAHTMGGFDPAAISAAFGLEERLVPTTITALGHLAAADLLPEPLAERESAPRSRKGLDEIVLIND